MLSSPFRRAVDTIAPFAEEAGLPIELVENFREQNSGDGTPRNNGIPDEERNAHFVFLKQQWDDPSYKIGGGESLAEVQRRNIAALRDVLVKYPNRNIAIGTHGMALSAIINHYDPTYGFAAMRQMVDLLPWAVEITFDGDHCVTVEKIDLL